MKEYIRYLFLVILLLSLINPVSAVGIMAHNIWVKLDYEPNLEFSQKYWVDITSDYSQDYNLYLKGDLAEYVTLEPDHFKDMPPDSKPSFIATLRLPEGLDKKVKPGVHSIRVGVIETASSSGGGVGVLTAAQARIDVRLLYPGKWLEAILHVKDVEVNKPANFKVSIFNGGKEDFNSIRAKIEVYDPNDKNVGRVYTEEKPLKSNARDTLHSQLDTKGLKSGEYKAVATVYYDGEELKTNEAKFKIGSQEVWIIDYTREVPAGRINPFDIEIESRWNNNIPDVYASVKIGRQTFHTPTTSINPWERKTITGYLDTTTMKVGEYGAVIILNYGENKTKETGKVNVTEPEGIMPTPIASNATILLAIIIILLVVIDIGYLIYSKKKKEEKSEKYIKPKKPRHHKK